MVVGGGLAGLAAATVLAERGVAVTVVEREPWLGGRAGAWPDRWADGTPFQMDRGFRAFHRQSYNLRALLRRADPTLSCLAPLPDYPLLGPHGERETFRDLPRTTPLNLVQLVRRSPRLGLRALARLALRPALALLAYDGEATRRAWDHLTARDWLEALRVPPEARELLLEKLTWPVFDPEERVSAAHLLMQLHFSLLGNPEGMVFDVLRDSFATALWDPLRARLQARGVRFALGSAARRLVRAGGGWRVDLSDDRCARGDVVVLAVDVPALKGLVAASPALRDPETADWRRQVAALGVARPYAVWRLAFERPLHPGREASVATTGLGALDSVTRHERVAAESRRWAQARHGTILELHAYAVPQDVDPPALRADLLYNLHALYPETRSAGILDDRWLLRQDCPSFPPGSDADRPGVETPIDGLALAGDGLRLPFPAALMERAVASGFLAANALLRRWGVRPEEIWTVPRRGLLAAVLG